MYEYISYYPQQLDIFPVKLNPFNNKIKRQSAMDYTKLTKKSSFIQLDLIINSKIRRSDKKIFSPENFFLLKPFFCNVNFFSTLKSGLP